MESDGGSSRNSLALEELKTAVKERLKATAKFSCVATMQLNISIPPYLPGFPQTEWGHKNTLGRGDLKRFRLHLPYKNSAKIPEPQKEEKEAAQTDEKHKH